MTEMEEVLIWIDTSVFLPMTTLFFYCVYCVGKRYQGHVIYYTNLLISILIHHSIIFFQWRILHDTDIEHFVYYFAVTASLYFKSCIALERYCFIACPLLDCLKRTKGAVLICTLVWVFCIVSVPLAIILSEILHFIIYAALPAPLFIFCLAGTLKALPAATSVPTEEKRRTVGALVLLLLNYFLINLPAIGLLTLKLQPNFPVTTIDFIIITLFLFSSLLDFILFAFMRKGPIDRLLACLCCCSMESNNTGDVINVSTDRSDHVVRDEGKEETGSHDGEDDEELASVR